MQHRYIKRLENPGRNRDAANKVGKYINTPGFRTWYDADKCPGAPVFEVFWAYVAKSLRYDYPSYELVGVVWEATQEVFQRFDASKGDQSLDVESRFLTYWRGVFRDVIRREFGVTATRMRLRRQPMDNVVIVDDAEDVCIGSRVALTELVDRLPESQRAIVRRRYFEGETLTQIAKDSQTRKASVLASHNAAILELKNAWT